MPREGLYMHKRKGTLHYFRYLKKAPDGTETWRIVSFVNDKRNSGFY